MVAPSSKSASPQAPRKSDHPDPLQGAYEAAARCIEAITGVFVISELVAKLIAENGHTEESLSGPDTQPWRQMLAEDLEQLRASIQNFPDAYAPVDDTLSAAAISRGPARVGNLTRKTYHYAVYGFAFEVLYRAWITADPEFRLESASEPPRNLDWFRPDTAADRWFEVCPAVYELKRDWWSETLLSLCGQELSAARTLPTSHGQYGHEHHDSPQPPLDESGLSPCQRDCLKVIRDAGRRLVTGDVQKHLQDAGMLHGDSTVKGALAVLVKTKHLTTRSDRKPRGYGLPGWQ